MVAPLAGAWIETALEAIRRHMASVAPLAGAWIETQRLHLHQDCAKGRAPRGRVD